MKKTWTILALFFCVVTYAQENIIKAKIIDENGDGVSFATVILQLAADSSMTKADATTLEGEIMFSDISAEQYMMQISYVGYNTLTTEVFQHTGGVVDVGVLTLHVQSTDLAEVVVKSTRPIVEVQPDKTVFNVDGSVNAVGHTALELLRKSPGVVVDNNDNLILQGKNGVQVYIDGKKSSLSGDDLANYLKSMQSTEIDAIEIITNPSSKYEAEGNAGIINIRLKKNQSLGFNGSANLGFQQGINSKYNGSVNFNYREKHFNTFGSYNGYTGRNENDFFLYREQQGVIYDQININNNDNQNQGFRLGSDLFINDKNTIGFLVSGNMSEGRNWSTSNTDIMTIGTEILDSVLLASNTINDARDNYSFNVNYAYKGENGKYLNVDLDYATYKNRSTSFQPNRYLLPDLNTLLFERTFSNVTPTDINIYTAKVDYETNFLKGKFGIGAKSSVVTTDNTFDNFDIIDGVRIKNLDRSNNFVYQENINAVYINWQRALGDKANVSLGLRGEHTHSMGDLTSNQTQNDEVVNRDYFNLFPSAGLTYQINEKNGLRLNYSRRIDRPNYQNLNPFEFKLDELTFQSGNPFLNPQYSNNYSLSHSYNRMLNTTLSYTVINDMYTQITKAVDERASTLTYENLANQKNLALTVSYPFQLAKWWNVYATSTAYILSNQADIDGGTIDLNAKALNFYAQNTFMLPKGIKAELSGWYNSPTLWGNWTTVRQYDVSAGISKSFWDNNATIKLTISDLFYTNGWGGESSFGSLYIRGGGNWESRRARLNFTYQFGNKQVKASRNRKTGLEEERGRI